MASIYQNEIFISPSISHRKNDSSHKKPDEKLYLSFGKVITKRVNGALKLNREGWSSIEWRGEVLPKNVQRW